MALWNNNDREESKPTWLNKIDKRLCTRTFRGWEMPKMGSLFAYGATGFTATNGVPRTGAIFTELLVALPNDPSITGVTSSSFAARGSGGFTHAEGGQGLTIGSDTPNYAPYFTCPFSGDGPTAGGIGGSGVSHGFFTYVLGAGITPASQQGYQYGVDKLGVSSLGGGLTGVTAYIKVVANDANFTNNLTIGLSGTYSGFNIYTGSTNLNDATKVPPAVFKAFFGPTATDDRNNPYRYDNIAVLVAHGNTAHGHKNISLKVDDGTLTGFSTLKMSFDRPAGLTTAGLASYTISDFVYYNYDKSR
jgi:hypothetical protein